MHVGKQFSFYAYLQWTKREILVLFILALIPTILFSIFHMAFVVLPLFLATILGTTVAFVISFKNNAAYARLHEAQKFYSDIQSASNYFSLVIKSLLTSENKENLKDYIPQLIKQHVAWLTTLRYQLRKEKPWENLTEGGNRDFTSYYKIFENEMPLEAALQPYLSQQEILTLMTKRNPGIYCLQLQIQLIKLLAEKGFMDPKSFQFLETIINHLNIGQTYCIGLKNSPYPRNFYSITKYFLIGFLILLPYSLVGELAKMDRVWVTIPVSMLISWMFVCLEKVGQNTTNPFEGGINDVPISNISKSIEIDMNQILDQPDIPEEIKPINEILL